MNKARRVFLTAILLPLLSIGTGGKPLKETAKVGKMISEFNRKLFVELDAEKAIKEHFFLTGPDPVDLEAGFSALFPQVTKRISSKKKLEYFTMDFYFELGIPALQWGLGRIAITEKTELLDADLLGLNNGELEKIWNEELKSLKIDPDLLERSEETVEQDAMIAGRLVLVIRNKVDLTLVNKNLNFIESKQLVDKKVHSGRSYYTVQNKLFIYKVAIKNGVPKIMNINRARG